MSNIIPEVGALYIVATPIGNLGDISGRALDTLRDADEVLAEDTRHSKRLFMHFGMTAKLTAYHEHNEQQRIDYVLQQLAQGKTLALISDAGTPLISDPGYVLVRAAQEQGYKVSPIPGACSIVAALSASGMPTDRFVYEGFLPAKSGARQNKLAALVAETRTLVFLESSHRITASLQDMRAAFGDEREAVLARELTKQFETIKRLPLAAMVEWVVADTNQQRGEFVVLVHGARASSAEAGEVEHILRILLEQLPVKQAADIASRLTGEKKNELYKKALVLKKQ